jgi:hypothetical protein
MQGNSGKIYNRHRYEHVSELLETSDGAESPYFGINKCKPIETSLTINKTS